MLGWDYIGAAERVTIDTRKKVIAVDGVRLHYRDEPGVPIIKLRNYKGQARNPYPLLH